MAGNEKFDAISKSMDRGSVKIRTMEGAARVVHDVHAEAGFNHKMQPVR